MPKDATLGNLTNATLGDLTLACIPSFISLLLGGVFVSLSRLSQSKRGHGPCGGRRCLLPQEGGRGGAARQGLRTPRAHA